MQSHAFDFELEAVVAGLKPAALKESVRATEANSFARTLRERGLFAEVVHRHGRDAEGAHREGDAFATVAIAKERAALDEVLALQQRHRVGEQAAPVRDMARLMGYPSCCADAFAQLADRGDNLANERLPFRRAPGAPLHPLLHRLAAVRVISHHICAPNCAPSIAMAERVIALATAAAESYRATLATPVLFATYDLRAALRGHWEGDRFIVEQLTPLAGDWPSDGLVAIRVDAHGVSFEGGIRARIDCEHPLLTVPGEALAPAALAAIGGVVREQPIGEPPSAPPSLPKAFRAGARAGEFTIERLDREGLAHLLRLRAKSDAHGGPFAIAIRSHEVGKPYTIRRGRWAIDVADAERLSPEQRRAIAAVVRALP